MAPFKASSIYGTINSECRSFSFNSKNSKKWPRLNNATRLAGIICMQQSVSQTFVLVTDHLEYFEKVLLMYQQCTPLDCAVIISHP